jgi:hypothetical protein
MTRRACALVTMALALAPGMVHAADATSAPLAAAASADTLGAPAPPPVATPPTGPDFPRGRISGYVFGDLYWNAVGDPRHAYAATGADSGKAYIDASGKPITRDLNGVQIRRIYFQLDNDLSIRYATRLRFEADSKELTSGGKITIFVKNAYLQAKSVWPRGDVYVGMQTTPTWENAEEFWAYRPIEKTIGDFLGLAPASDLGLETKGFVDGAHHVGYAAMVGDGTGQKPETNRDKRFYFALPLRAGTLRIEPYADYENGPESTDKATYKVFAGWEPPHSAIGVEAYDRVSHAPGGNAELRAWSVFARWNGTPTLGAFARVDGWDPNRRVASRLKEQLWIAGLDWQPVRDVHVMPNVEATQYDAAGTFVAPAHHDLQARVTFYYKFAKPQS